MSMYAEVGKHSGKKKSGEGGDAVVGKKDA
jgi:hypothetical protein